LGELTLLEKLTQARPGQGLLRAGINEEVPEVLMKDGRKGKVCGVESRGLYGQCGWR
jgi:hypothetical protein